MSLSRFQAALNAVCLILLVAFLLAVSGSLINSDSAVSVLLADHLLRSGTLVSTSWAYVSDSLMLDGGLAPALAGALLWGPTLKAFVLTAAVGASFALAACYTLSRTLGASRVDAITAALVVLLGPSLIYMDLVVGLGISIQLALVVLFIAAFVRFVFRQGGALALAATLAIPLLMMVSSPKKALVYLLLPALFAVVALMLGRRTERDGEYSIRRLWLLSAALLVVAASGTVLHAWALVGIHMNSSYAKLDMALDPRLILSNVKTVAQLFLRFSGQGNSAFPLAGIVLAPAVLLLFTIAPLLGRRPRTFIATPLGFAYVFAVVGVAGIAAYLLTYQEIKLYYGIYYLLIPLAPLVAVAAATASQEDTFSVVRSSLRASLLAMLLLAGANMVSLLHAFPKKYTGIGENQQTTHAGQVAAVDWLRRHGISRGFAGYWDANALTLLSDGAIQVTGVSMPKKGRKLRRLEWLSDAARIDFSPRGEKWFIAIPVRRRSVVLSPECKPPDATARVGGYRIYVFERDLPDCIPAPRGRRQAGSAVTAVRPAASQRPRPRILHQDAARSPSKEAAAPGDRPPNP